MPKAIIIGAGIAGIATSIRLAVKGYAVDVYESNKYPGGKLTSFQKDGFHFDAGPSLFTLPELVTELFDLCKVEPTDYFNYSKHDTVCNYFWSDQDRFSMPSDLELAIDNLSEHFGEPKDNISKYLSRSQNKYDKTKRVFLERSLHKASTYFSFDTLKALLSMGSLDISTSLNSLNQKSFSNPKLVQLFNRFATYNGSSPYKTPGIMSMIPHLEMGLGTYFPEGGMRSITNSLVKLAENMGVKFHYNHPVDEIRIRGHEACGIRIGNRDIDSDMVVTNMDVFSTYSKLLPQVQGPAKVLNQERSSSALIFYWGMKGEFKELDLHNIFFSEQYEEEFDSIFNKKNLHNDPTVYVNISNKCNPSDSPKGCENWFVMINTPGDSGQDWDVLIETARRNILKKLSDVLGHDLESKIQSESILDPRLIESKTQSYKGSLYGTASNSKFSAFLRHPNFSTKFKNLYFVGGSVHPGGGIPLCLNSAKIVDNLIA